MSWSFNNPFHPVYSLSLIMILLCLAIYAGKLYISKAQKNNLRKNLLSSRTKNTGYSVLKNRQRPMFFALILSILFAFLSMNWTIPVKESVVEIIEISESDILTIKEIPRTLEKKKEIPKPKTIIRFEPIKGDPPSPEPIKPDPEPVFIGKATGIKKAPQTEIQKPPIIKPKREKAERVFIIVEEEPLFNGCESILKIERKACATKAFFNYLKEHVKYPTLALENGIQGNVIVQFIVEKDGSISNTKVLRGVGGGCDEEAQRVIENMPKWTPGRQRGRPVRVQFTLPVRFILQ